MNRFVFRRHWMDRDQSGSISKLPVMTAAMSTRDISCDWRDETIDRHHQPVDRYIDLEGGERQAPKDGTLPPKDQVYGSIEGGFKHLNWIMTNRGFTRAARRGLKRMRRQWRAGVYIVSAGDTVHAGREPGGLLYQYQVFPKRSRALVSDVVAVLWSINVMRRSGPVSWQVISGAETLCCRKRQFATPISSTGIKKSFAQKSRMGGNRRRLRDLLLPTAACCPLARSSPRSPA